MSSTEIKNPKYYKDIEDMLEILEKMIKQKYIHI